MKEFCTLKNLFTGICTLLAGYLIGKAVYDFLVTKPTSTSHEVVNLDAKTFPYVVICGDPVIDQNSSKKYGYDDPSAYWGGRNGSWYGSFIGWNGREGKDNSTEIRDQLLNVKAESGLLESDYYVLLDGSYGFNNQSNEFIMVTFPYGRCQLVRPPDDLNITGHWLTPSETTLNLFTSLNILLMDPVNSPLVFPTNFQMKGSPIKAHMKTSNKDWHPYQVKVSQSHHLPGDPQYACKEYSLNDTYSHCIKREWKMRFLKLLNCTPPMLDADHTCDVRFDPKQIQSWKIDELFFYWNFGTEWNNRSSKLLDNTFSSSDCF